MRQIREKSEKELTNAYIVIGVEIKIHKYQQ